MEPNFQSPVSNPSEGKPKVNVFLLILIFLLLLVVLYIFGNSFSKTNNPAPDKTVEVTQVDLMNTAGSDRLPAGFPRDIPVEADGAFESYAMNYTDRGIAQYTVSFNSGDSLETIYDTYSTYLSSTGFTIISNVADSSVQRTLYANRNGDDINIVMTREPENQTVVQISYLDRN